MIARARQPTRICLGFRLTSRLVTVHGFGAVDLRTRLALAPVVVLNETGANAQTAAGMIRIRD
jgi:hypothetical protein